MRAPTYLASFTTGWPSSGRSSTGNHPYPGVTTNPLENVSSQMDVRLKEIGRRWSLEGATNMVRVFLTKIFRPELWEEHLATLRGVPDALTVEVKILDQASTS